MYFLSAFNEVREEKASHLQDSPKSREGPKGQTAGSKGPGILWEKSFQGKFWVVEGKWGKDARSKCSPQLGLDILQWKIRLLQCKYHFSLFSKLNIFSIAEICSLWIKEILEISIYYQQNLGPCILLLQTAVLQHSAQKAVVFSKGSTDHGITLTWD